MIISFKREICKCSEAYYKIQEIVIGFFNSIFIGGIRRSICIMYQGVMICP